MKVSEKKMIPAFARMTRRGLGDRMGARAGLDSFRLGIITKSFCESRMDSRLGGE